MLGSTQDKLVQLGQLGPEVNSILGDIGTVMGTVGFAESILGGSSGGLSGVIQTGPNGTSVVTQYRNSPTFLGTSQTSIYNNTATTQPVSSDKLSVISQYETSWSSIRAAAITASTTLGQLITACSVAKNTPPPPSGGYDPALGGYNYQAWLSASNAELAVAQTAYANVVAPVLAQVDTAFANIAAAKAAVDQVQQQMLSTSTSTQNQSLTTLASLDNIPPTLADIGTAQQDALAFGMAVATPTGSLNISGGSMIDRMNLVTQNAPAFLPQCAQDNYTVAPQGG